MGSKSDEKRRQQVWSGLFAGLIRAAADFKEWELLSDV